MLDWRWQKIIKRIGLFLITVIVTMLIVFPFYWMIVNSLQTGQGRFAYPPRFFPDDVGFSSYRTVLKETDVGRWLLNSLSVSLSASVAALVIGAWGAYAISRFQIRGMRFASYIILTTQMIPPIVLMIPLFKLFRQLGLIDKLGGLVVANFVFTLPVTIWMLKSIFDAIPVEIEEAALVDGCNRMEVLAKITGPLSAPGFVAAGIFAFISSWDEFMFTRLVITHPDKWVGSVGIVSFIGEWAASWDQMMAAASMFTVVPVILFLLVQRYFIASLVGGVKG
jgi:multiple sugar transport system permease protein